MTYTTSCPDCPFVSKPRTSQALADKALRQHTCDRQRTIARRAEQRLNPPSGDERPCTCRRVTHPHGSTGRYWQDACRCRPCRDAVARHNRGVELGRRVFVDPRPAVEHVANLNAAGMSFAVMAKASGLTTHTLRVLHTRKAIHPDTARRILATRPAVHPGHLVPAYRATRRLQALAYLGWTSTELAAHTGVSRSTIIVLTAGAWEVRASTVLAVRRTYDTLWDKTPPPGTRGQNAGHAKTRAHARRQGWAPPAAWDDIDRDDAPAPRWDVDDPDAIAAAERERAKAERRNARARADRAARNTEGVAA